VRFRFKNSSKIANSHFRRADAKKLAAIALLPAASAEQTAAPAMVQLCPDCCNVLTPGQYGCRFCGLIFKNERSMVLGSILLPGGGYFYTGHPLVAILPAIAEGLLSLDVLVRLISLMATRTASPDLAGVVTGLLVVWALETSVTIPHCRRYVRDFIPEKRDPMRSQVADIAKHGGAELTD
jgi:hypothetical protein